MSEETPQRSSPKEDSSKSGESSALVKPESRAEERLEAAIKKALAEQNIPQPQQERIVETFREVFTTYIERNTGAEIDPEIFKIVAASIDKEQENKLKYFTLKEQNSAEKSKREHDFEVERHRDVFKIVRPVVYVVLTTFPILLFIGIYLAATGHETLGASILSTVITSFLSYLAGRQNLLGK
jgi:hypothetical protein